MAEAQEEEADEKKQEEEEEQQQHTLKNPPSSSFLWRGLRLGKRVAIAGAAIAAVPAVIPTIFVGVALSFPFGVYLAGFALTDRVMRFLLSTSSEIGLVEDEKKKEGILMNDTEAALERLVGEEGVVHCKDERDEPTLLTAEQKIDMWPPTTNLNILTEEGDDFGGTRTGKERHAEERDEPTPLTAEQKIDMWPPTSNLNILTEEGDDFGGIGTNKERHAEERDEPTPLTAEQKIDMWLPTTNLNILSEGEDGFGGTGSGEERLAEERDELTLLTAEQKIDRNLYILTDGGGDFGGTGIGKERHAEGVTYVEDICDPEQETKIKFEHTSSLDDKEDIIGDIGVEEEERQMQAERGLKENEERKERDEKDKQNTNEELKIWSSDNSSNDNDYVERGFLNTKGVDKPFEVIGKGKKKKTKEEMEIQGLAAPVPEVKQYPMTSYPSGVAMPKGTNNEIDQTILSSKCPAAIEKGDRMRVEEVQQPEMFLERRSGGTEDMVQDANEERVNGKDGIEPIQSSYVFESAVEHSSSEENRDEEGIETIGLTEDGRSASTPNVEDLSARHSFVSAAPLDCENQMASLNLRKEYASPIRDHPSDVTDVESGPAHTVVDIAGVLHISNEVPSGQDEVERDEPALVQNEIDTSPLTINLNTPSEERDNMDGTQISEEQSMEGLRGRELYNCDAEQDTKIKFEFASSIGNEDVTPDNGMVQEERQMQAESGSEKSENREEMEKMEDEKVKVNEEQKIGSLHNSLNLNDYMQRGHASAEGADIVIELSGNGTVDKKKVEEEMEIQGLTTAVPEAKHHRKTPSPFAAVMPDNETEQRVLSSTSSSVAEKGNESRMQEVKQPETTLDGRARRIEDEVHDLPPAAIETMEPFPTVHHSLAAVPEEREIDFELPGLSSERSNKEVKGKTVKEANEEEIGQEGMESTQRNYVISSVVSVECKSVFEQFAVKQNLNDRNPEDGICDAISNIEETTVYHSFVAAESESDMAPSSLSTEYASAVEDHCSYMTDAESGPSVTTVETAGMVHFHDEVSYSEEIIWDQMYAMRTIVGYKAALHSTLAEELKALYLVIGVESPISLSDTSDIMEISDKLKFLKSVVGVE